MNFSEALRAIADDETNGLKDRDRKKLKRVAGNKRRCKRCEERAELEAHKAKKDSKLKSYGGDPYGDRSNYGFDWSGLLEFLKGLLPIILSFIDALN